MSVMAMGTVSIVGLAKERHQVMEALHHAGVLHIVPLPHEAPCEELTAQLKEESAHSEQIDKALGYLQALPSPKRVPNKTAPLKALAAIDALIAQDEKLCARIQALRADCALYEPFGDFAAQACDLERGGVSLQLAKVSGLLLEELKEKACYIQVLKEEADTYWLLIMALSPLDLGDAAIAWPRKGLKALKAELKEAEALYETLRNEASSWAYQVLCIEKLACLSRERLARLRELQKARIEHSLFGLSGYVLMSEVDAFKKALTPFALAFNVKKPELDEDVPVKLKNPKAIRGFEAIVRAFTGINYQERDKTPLVFVLFALFGSLCLLDAGYGLLLFVIGYVLAIKKSKDFGQIFMWTGACSTVLGIFCGQFFGLVFGQDIFKSWPPIIALATDPLVCFKFSLLVGLMVMALSYIVALVQNGLKNNALGSFFGVSTLAFLVLGKSGVLEHYGVEGFSCEIAALTTLSLMVVAWLVFPEQVFGAKARIANIVWTLYSGPVGLIQDIMSHMRLFGIALSGAILALVINKIASMLPMTFGFAFAAAGHFFVFLLALLSLYIHSNRLIFLEFGGKCMSGGNNYFSPFSRSNS